MASEDGASGFDMALHYALGKFKMCNVELKEQQRAVLKHVYDRRDVFVWLATCYGKSLCYQLVPFMADYKLGKCDDEVGGSVVTVVSPLLSLMIEQVQRLRECGVSSVILGLAGSGSHHWGAVWRDILLRPCLRSAVAAVAIDEAHCVSKWGKDFRSTYGRVLELRALVLPGVPMLALTATVTDLIRKDVITSLDMEGCKIVCHSPNRPNIYYEVKSQSDIATDMTDLVTSLRMYKKDTNRTIVYCRTMDMCADLYAYSLHSLAESSYFPLGADPVSDNPLWHKVPKYSNKYMLCAYM